MLGRQLVEDPGAGKVHSRLVMSTDIRGAILHRNQELKKNAGALKPLDWGQWALSIPQLDFQHFKRKYPALFTGTGADRKKAVEAFLRSPESEPYRVKA